MSEVKTQVEEVELDAKALEAIASKTGEALIPEVETKVKEAVADANKELEGKVDSFIEKFEDSNKKQVEKAEAAKTFVQKGIEEGKIDKAYAEMSAAKRFYLQVRAMDEEDREKLKAINRYNLATQLDARAKAEGKGAEAVSKAGYGNSTVPVDGGVLIPDAEFVTTVFENLPKYGVAFSDADVRQTDRTSVRVINLDKGLTFYQTAEAGVKTSDRLSFSKNEQSLLKYAVIVPAADEFTDDAVIDYWNLVTRELTRAYARKADEIVFTDQATGITNLPGVITQPTSGAGTTVNWSDLLTAEGKVEDDLDTSGFKWYLRKETWFRLIGLRGTTNDHYLAGSLNTNGWVANPNSPTTPWGTPVKFTRVLPSSGPTVGAPGAVANNDAFGVYGNLKNYMLYNKRGMAITMLTEATIVDAAGQSLNLATQDATAMRAVVRMLGIVPTGVRSRFVILGTGTVS